MTDVTVELPRAAFCEPERPFLRSGELEASLFRFASGVEAVRLRNRRGHVLALPFLGGMVWDAAFDGVRLGMESMFPEPRPATVITGTYGCLLFHAGLLRNGCPGPEDTHALHGEMPCAPMDAASLQAGDDADGPFIRLLARRTHAEGFGAHYHAVASTTLRAGASSVEVGLEVRNESGKPMDLMYMAHANFGFPVGARIVQPAAWTPDNVRVRTAIPSHVQPTPEYERLIETLQRDPAALRTLDDPARLAAEQVFYLSGLRPDQNGRITVLLERPEGDGFAISWQAGTFSHCVRWLLYDPDQRVAAIALPSTCEPEGYAAERRKGNVRTLAPGESAGFAVQLAYLDKEAATAQAAAIER